MADAPTQPASKTLPKKPPHTPGVRPDMATLGGIAVALAGILGGLLLENGSIQDVAQATAAMIVLGGTLGAVLITSPLPVFLRACRGVGSAFFERADSTSDAIEQLIQFAAKARKNGIVALETDAAAVTEPFLRKALNLAVDGTDLQEIRKMMELEIAISEQTAEAEAKVWEAAGGYAPTVGIIGAVMGLIQVMKNLEDIKAVGHGIAVAFVATLYGVGVANIFFLPVANKLKARMRAAVLLKDLALEGVSGIVEGLNPTLLRAKLEAYLPSGPKPAKEKNAKVSPAAEAVSGKPAPGAG